MKRNVKSENISDYKTEKVNFEKFKYCDALKFDVKGKYHAENNFARLPLKFKKLVRSKIWEISRYSSGISVRFRTNSPEVVLKWKLKNVSNFINMDRIATSGLDLYNFNENKWRYVNTAMPTGVENESLIVNNSDTTFKTFMVNLPLSDEVVSLEIGVKENTEISKPKEVLDLSTKPIVFYGTSITQGIGVSLPGMAYPSIISRDLRMECINLGFSGNGLFEESVGKSLCEIDAQLFVIDCTPNSSPAIIHENAIRLVEQIRRCNKNCPILLVESLIRENSYINNSKGADFGSLSYIISQNKMLSEVYAETQKRGLPEIYYLKGDGLIGFDHEGTVDGTHLTDLGSFRFANELSLKIKELLKLKKL